MELRQLQRFLAVVDEGSLAAAARTLGLTQQAMSASIATLEDDIAAKLFDRGPGGVTRPTTFGDALIPHARAQVAADRRARRALRAIADAEIGNVTVGIGESFAGDIVAEAILALHRTSPRLRVNVVEGYSESLLERFYVGEFDFVAVGVSNFSLREGYRAEVVYSVNDVVACRPQHPLLATKKLRLSDLEGYGWLVPYSRPTDLDVITETFTAEGLAPPTRFIGTDAYRIGMKVQSQSDLLVMTSPTLVTNPFARKTHGIRILPIDRPTVRRNASLVFNEHRPLTPAADAFLAHLRHATTEHASGGTA